VRTQNAAADAASAVNPGAALHDASGADIATNTSDRDFHPSSPDAFIRHMLPHAQAAARTLGVSPTLLIAQAALETGWGRAVPTHADGRSSFNLFGIKADARWQGERVANTTLEFVNGLAERRVEPFRSYSSYAASFADYSDFLRTNPRYGEALNMSSDAIAFARALQRAGYATDPNYASKIENIMASPGFDSALRDLKSADLGPMNTDSG
jgi:flagellar protein FlgJ